MKWTKVAISDMNMQILTDLSTMNSICDILTWMISSLESSYYIQD